MQTVEVRSAVVTMKRFALTVLVLALVGAGVYLFVRDTPSETAPRPLEDRAFVIGGHPSTCSQLVGQSCGFDLQTAYNDVGDRLEGFVHTAQLGPYADRIGVAASANLSLQACVLARTSGKTFLEFVDVTHPAHPEAGSPELFPFWSRARAELCPLYRHGW